MPKAQKISARPHDEAGPASPMRPAPLFSWPRQEGPVAGAESWVSTQYTHLPAPVDYLKTR
ncbi:hypothetical protein SAMN05421505_102171 [Sinosporangium album]|uniref:Uncharacterized protein n=1 Tax=Sinosporangium album TaxID=504805 RepID=A0A1G7S548_9ACTN|nr:hypothetical protein SAMN05421505_102171 [Sinosporangium album]